MIAEKRKLFFSFLSWFSRQLQKRQCLTGHLFLGLVIHHEVVLCLGKMLSKAAYKFQAHCIAR